MAKYTKQDIINMVEEEDVEFIRLQFTDIEGNFKNVAITAGQLEKALKPYYKEPEAPDADEHFGIGLHICRELCKKHGGTLSVANSIQGGAAVTASFFAG